MFKKKLPKHKSFNYIPQFYDPEQDEEQKELERRKRKLGFRNASRLKRRTKSPLIYLILVGLLIYIYLKLSGSI